jgi:thioredoxin reductase
VCDTGKPRNARADHVHAYLTRDGVLPNEFLRQARRDASRYPTIEFNDVEITEARRTSDGFAVTTGAGLEIGARKLLLATGVVDEIPEIDGLAELYGTSVHHCPYCDAWEWRNQPIAVYGRGEQGHGTVLALTVWSDDLVLCTDGPSELSGEQEEELAQAGIEVRTERVLRLAGCEGMLERIVFVEGEPLERRALFFCSGQRQGSGLAARLGCHFNAKGTVATGTCEATNVPGLYVAGDASKEAQFVIVAAAEGAEAGMAINKALLKEDLAQKRNSRPSRTSRGGPYAKSG